MFPEVGLGCCTSIQTTFYVQS